MGTRIGDTLLKMAEEPEFAAHADRLRNRVMQLDRTIVTLNVKGKAITKLGAWRSCAELYLLVTGKTWKQP